ncbi:MAG: hypothetical protein JWP32_997 [Schumannella sp.]|nr:hypothetical protein [Schumannella sp.]
MADHLHPDIDDDELLTRFAANTLPAFPHEEHLHVVFVKSGRATPAETLAFMRDGIRAMAAANGKPEAYHDTRTVAWVQIIVAARADFTGGFGDFLAAHPELVRRDLLSDYYSGELLNADAARASFTAPDLQELPTAS